jgi:surface protein
MAYIGVNDKARLIGGAYVGIDDVAHKVKKIYVGVKGKAELVWQQEDVGNYPTLKSGDTWYQSSFDRGQFTTIAIYDSFTPTAVTGVVESWAADVDGTGAIMCYVTGESWDRTLIIAGNGSGKIYTNYNSEYLFSKAPPPGSTSNPDAYKYTSNYEYFVNLTSIQGLTLLNTSNTRHMDHMFYYCRELIKPDLSLFNTYKVTGMQYMFAYTNEMGSLDLTGFNTKKVTNFSHMFYYCGAPSAEAFYGEWIINDTANVFNMFKAGNTNYLQEVTLLGAPEEPDTPDPDEPDTPVTPDPEEPEEPDTPVTPTGNKKCTLAPGSTWYKSSVSRNTIYSIRFTIGYNPTGEEDESWNADEQNAGYVTCYRIGHELIINSTNMGSSIYANPDSSHAFSYRNSEEAFIYLGSITGWKNFETTQIVNMEYMFAFCRVLSEIGINFARASRVTTMDSMFIDCDNLTSLYFWGSGIDSLTNISSMFMGCNNLRSVVLSWFNTKNVIDAQYMFAGCPRLEVVYVDIGYWDTSHAAVGNMFGFNTPISHVTYRH